jgi:hypothetical protein
MDTQLAHDHPVEDEHTDVRRTGSRADLSRIPRACFDARDVAADVELGLGQALGCEELGEVWVEPEQRLRCEGLEHGALLSTTTADDAVALPAGANSNAPLAARSVARVGSVRAWLLWFPPRPSR